jgi:two-component system chemotaxis sensor kinase CheA
VTPTQDPYRYFRVEARELVEQLGTGAMELEKGPPPADLVPRLLRLAHTLKGAARIVKQPEISELAHSIEDELAPLKGETRQAPHERVDKVLGLLDAITQRVVGLGPAPGEGETARSPHAPPEETFHTVRADVAEVDALLSGISEASVQLGAVRRNLDVVEKARNFADLLAAQMAAGRPHEVSGTVGVPFSERTKSLADDLRSVIAGLGRSLASGLDRTEREIRQVHEAAEHLRLLPASSLFSSLERTARDTARSTGKQAEFALKGGDVRLEAHVLGGVQRALIQLVRNAVAHGVEFEGTRTALGKPPTGHVLVTVVRRGGRAVFSCTDDGGGVDIEAVCRVAQAKGLSRAEVERLGPDGLLQILLRGGLTTTGVVTETSGRGIGLDIVRETVARLGGSTSVRTKAGQGTTVEFVLPVSVSSLDALFVAASGVTAAIPLDSVKGALRVTAADIARTPRGESVLYDGTVVPFLPLARSLRRENRSLRPGRTWSAIVVSGDAGLAAFGVDRVVGTGNVVLRPLSELAPVDSLVAGASLDPEGQPQIVLDPVELVGAALREEPLPPAGEAAPRAPVLVVDDSLTTRMLEQSILESAGYEVDCAVSGEEALEKARRRRYSLFLVDIEMPGIDGYDLLERLRADPVLSGIPAILVSSRSSQEDRRRGMELGARAFVAKGEFDQAALMATIRSLAG